MQQPDTNHAQEEVSIPVKVSDSIFMGDEVIAHVTVPSARTSSGSHSIRSPMSSIAQAGTVLTTPPSRACVS